LTPTRHSRELGQRFDEVVREYRREHSDLSAGDVRTALMTSLQRAGSAEDEARQRRVAILTVVAIVVAFIGAAVLNGQTIGGRAISIRVLGIVATVAAVAFAAIRFARRD
jgi:hypothetical protein